MFVHYFFKTASFGVSVKPKLAAQPKQTKTSQKKVEHGILLFNFSNMPPERSALQHPFLTLNMSVLQQRVLHLAFLYCV
jgi:hypothetical protein